MADKKSVDWEAKYKKLLAKTKTKNEKKDEFVLKNLEAFSEILDPSKPFMQKFGKRYCFARKDKKGQQMENVIKLNKLVNDLLEAKIRLNDNVDDNFSLRLSMDKGSLIRSLGGIRITPEQEVAFKKWKQDLKQGMAGKESPWKKQALDAMAELEKLKETLNAKATGKEIVIKRTAEMPEKKPKPRSVIDKYIAGNNANKDVERDEKGRYICPFPSADVRSDKWLDEHPAIDPDHVVFTE